MPFICIILQLGLGLGHSLYHARCWRPLPTCARSVVCISTIIIIMHYALCIMGTINGCGYDGQHKRTICDACRPCHSILSTLKPAFRWIRQICCSYNLLRCLDLQIWRFLCPQQWWQQRLNQLLYPCACARDNNRVTIVLFLSTRMAALCVGIKNPLVIMIFLCKFFIMD